MAGFEWRYNISGGRPLILSFLFSGTETLTKGDIVNLESGEMDLGVAADATLIGAFMGPEDPKDAKDGEPGVVEGTDSVTVGRAIVNPDAVYGVTDDNARLAGVNLDLDVTLDLDGATGAQTVIASSQATLFVVERKRANSDETRVMITPGEHYLDPN